MKSTAKKQSASKLGLIIIAIAVIVFVPACKKSTTNNSSFTGTYYGTLAIGYFNEADTVTITTGSTSSSIVMTSRTSQGSTYVITATTSGNSLNIPSQQVYVDTKATTYTTTGSGTLNNSAITINYTFVSPSNSSSYLTFTGTKK